MRGAYAWLCAVSKGFAPCVSCMTFTAHVHGSPMAPCTGLRASHPLVVLQLDGLHAGSSAHEMALRLDGSHHARIGAAMVPPVGLEPTLVQILNLLPLPNWGTVGCGSRRSGSRLPNYANPWALARFSVRRDARAGDASRLVAFRSVCGHHVHGCDSFARCASLSSESGRGGS